MNHSIHRTNDYKAAIEHMAPGFDVTVKDDDYGDWLMIRLKKGGSEKKWLHRTKRFGDDAGLRDQFRTGILPPVIQWAYFKE